MEQLDVFDELYNPLSEQTASIDRVHTEGLWHQTFACWLVNKERNTILLQLRGPRNRIDPGSFDASASGHLSAGEEPEHGFRELEEELGVSIGAENRFYLGLFRNIALRGAYINHEFCHVYLANSTYSFKDFTLQEGEVDAIFEMEINEAIDLFSNKRSNLTLTGQTETREITIEDMCNHHERTKVSHYYLKVMLAARDMIDGKTLLAI